MFAYMTEMDTVDIVSTVDLEAEGTLGEDDEIGSLLYHFLDELLFHFSGIISFFFLSTFTVCIPK